LPMMATTIMSSTRVKPFFMVCSGWVGVGSVGNARFSIKKRAAREEIVYDAIPADPSVTGAWNVTRGLTFFVSADAPRQAPVSRS